jgi:hypothetical protein
MKAGTRSLFKQNHLYEIAIRSLMRFDVSHLLTINMMIGMIIFYRSIFTEMWLFRSDILLIYIV